MKNVRPPQNARDPNHVNVDDAEDVRYWADKFGCATEELKAAIKKVGPNPQAVRAELGCKVRLVAHSTNFVHRFETYRTDQARLL
jgi:hypothetical protein